MKKILMMCAVFVLTAACGSGNYVLTAKYPTEPQSLEPATDITVKIVAVDDAREFVDVAEMIKQPTIWDDEPLTTDKSRIIGVQTGGGGSDLGSVYLDETQSLEKIMEMIVGVSFRQAGFDVVDDDDADLTVEVSVDQFWVWVTPDAMTVRVESIFSASLAVTGEGVDETVHVTGYNDSPDVARSPESYTFCVNEGLYDFYTQLATTLIQKSFEPPPPPE